MLKSFKSAAEYALGVIGLAFCFYAGYALTLIVGGAR